MFSSSSNRTWRVLAPVLFGLGGVVIGAGAAMLLTPRTGAQIRKLLFGFFSRSPKKNFDSDGEQLDRMSSEGGVHHERPAHA